MEVTQFYLHLPSNSSLDKYPNNTLTEYRVCLPQTVSLTGDWEVALTEIHYPHSWNNLQGNFATRFDIRNHELFGQWESFRVPPGYYSSIGDIILKMNELVDNEKRFGDDVKFTYDTLNRKVTVHLQNNAELFFDDIGYLLGFPPRQPFSTTTTADRAVDLEYGFHDLYVYCDIVQPQYVGDALVPLLRIVPVEGNDGQRISKSFVRPQYIPVSRKQFQSIEVNIKRDTGASVPFECWQKRYKKESAAKKKQFASKQEAENISAEEEETRRGIFIFKVDMAFVHHESQECTKSELDLFTIPATQTSITKGQWIEYHPLTNITDSGPIEFNVSGTGEEYLDLAKTQLFVKAKITKANGTALDAETKVGPVNLFLHSLFSQVDVSLNE
ncbi:hypothetical protein ACROYT_G030105 [Oculina patagonica]